tara:strand:- start:3340 stop:4203 length:864 start_codon:yes stop_codon:yes gene_type:complete
MTKKRAKYLRHKAAVDNSNMTDRQRLEYQELLEAEMKATRTGGNVEEAYQKVKPFFRQYSGDFFEESDVGEFDDTGIESRIAMQDFYEPTEARDFINQGGNAFPMTREYADEREPEEIPEDFLEEVLEGKSTDETPEDRLERQIDYYNSMRDHVFDSDEGYMQGQDPESLERQLDNREMTQIVEALQRQAMQQGNVGATVNMPFDPNSVPSNQGFPMTPAGPNPIIQALRNQNQMVLPGSDVNSLYDPYNARQTLQYGGGQQGYAHPGIRGGPSRFGGGGSNTPSYL